MSQDDFPDSSWIISVAGGAATEIENTGGETSLGGNVYIWTQ